MMPTKAVVRRAFTWRWLDRVLPVLFVLSLAVVCFIGGAYVAEFDMPWYQRVLQPSFQGMRALEEQRDLDRHIHGWYRARDDKTGITVHQPELAYHGLTLYTSCGGWPSAQLISMTGKVVHRWELPFHEAWSDPSHVPTPVSDDRIHWWRVRLFPNGDLIANYAGIADTPNGYGLVKVDKDSRLIWRYADCTHHDFDLDDAGRIYALTHSIQHQRVKRARHLRTPLLEDYVVVLSPEGEELQRVAIFDAFARTKFRDYLKSMPSNEKGDHTHTNTIDVVSKAFAKKHEFCSAGDVMISLRNPGVLAILSLKRKRIVWAARGMWERQHDSDPLPNGNILLFDNKGNHDKWGRSRILEWNLITGAIEWYYYGTRETPFESLSRGCQQLLPNGNVLVAESNKGRIFEITRDRQIVWEFCNPRRSGKNNDLVAAIFNAERHDASELTFLNPDKIAQSSASGSRATAESRN